MARRRRPEQVIQKAVLEHLTVRAVPNTFWFHVPSGGYRSPIEAKILKSIGARAGVPDLLIIRGGQAYALELKSADGRLSPVQRTTHVLMAEAGAKVEVATGIDEAIRQLENWGLLRGRAAVRQ
jgi:hypothetical protein